jgi:uncharacterized membrane-anchored protein
MRTLFLTLAGFVLLGNSTLRADDPPPQQASKDDRAAIASSLKWQTGTITLQDGLAKIDLAPGYRFLGGADSEKVLHDLWGNPPNTAPLGMLFPPNKGPLDPDGWGVIVEYEDQGHVNDADAAKINYADLLKQMQQGQLDNNANRKRDGYAPMELVGWAQPPHYDAATHKLYWAKELHVGDDSSNGLNYEIRVLGRKGTLDLTAVAGMSDLDTVSAKMPDIMSMVDFKPGNTYAEFDPHIDKVAKYGIAALIAGGAVGVAAKVGLFKLAWVFLLGAKKVLIVAIVAIGAAFKKMMAAIKGKSGVARPFQPPTQGGAP